MKPAYWIRKITGLCCIVGAINAQGWITRTGETLPVNDPVTWDRATKAYIGVTGEGTLRIDSGSQLKTYTTSIGYTSTAAGHVAVTGFGVENKSYWYNRSELKVGDYGQGALEISNGAKVDCGATMIGVEAGSTGLIAVDGEGSQFEPISVIVGSFGAGSLQISNGGDVSITNDSSCYVGYNYGGAGAVTVSGVGSTWGMAGGLRMGDYAPATLSILLGGVVNTGGDVIMGDIGPASASVSGTSSAWGMGGKLRLGTWSKSGELNISLGGLVTTAGEVSIGEKSEGTVNVGGAGSSWFVAKEEGLRFFYVGQEGRGRLNITSGGYVDNSGELFYSVLGDGTNSSGTVVVDGVGSLWNTALLRVGKGGTGSLTISNGGTVNTEIGGVSKGTATVEGPAANWQLYELQVGDRLHLLNGGWVNTTVGTIDNGGQIYVEGTDSSLMVKNGLCVGDEGNGTLMINGGLCSAQQMLMGPRGGTGRIELRDGGRLLLADSTWAEGNGAAEFLDLIEGSDELYCVRVKEVVIDYTHTIVTYRTLLRDAIAGLDYHLVHFDSGIWAGYTMLWVPLDEDRDGIDDRWEQAVFGNLTTADATSDFDGGGKTDLQEYLEATNAKEAPLTVSFFAGDHGTLAGANSGANVILPRDFGVPLSAPAVSSHTNWVFFGWNPALPASVTASFSTTAQYEVDSDNDGIGDSTDPDADGDDLPDFWERYYFGDLSADGNSNPDNDAYTTAQEYILDYHPTISNGLFRITIDGSTIGFISSPFRRYRLFSRPSMVTGEWSFVESKLGVNGPDSMNVTNGVSQEFYKLEVELP